MTKIEKHFRTVTLGERARQLQSEIIALSEGSYRLHLAAIFAGKLAVELESAVGTGMDLETMLRLSIETVKERKQCEVIGSLRLETQTERAHAANVSPFPKPSTTT